MTADGSGALVVIGGTSGLGRELAQHYAVAGRPVVVTGRDAERASTVADEIARKAGSGSDCVGLAVDLAHPHDIADALSGVGAVDFVVLAAIEREANSVTDYDIDRAIYLTTMKLVGYTEVVHTLLPRIDRQRGAVLMFGGQAKERPYPGSVTVTTVNGGIATLVNTLIVELKPLRVNAIHPGVVLDSPYWVGNDSMAASVVARTPTGRGPAMTDVVDACVFLLENRSVNGVNLAVDGGWLLG
jgi:NAD(P)-dependent dehydrogenase (short-subunit alcohol dehydrogenase family)